MFRSKKRDIIIPQSEHARLSGLLAHLWGNAVIALPPIDQAKFTLGVTLHDRGYGSLDSMGIGEVDETVWLATQQRGIEIRLNDPTADTVALLHIRRLLSYTDHAGTQPIIARAEQRIAKCIERTSHSRETFEQADTVTRICDMISFKFCFEEPVAFEQTVISYGEPIAIRITIMASGQIRLDPWPLSVPEVRGFILGYEATGYPDHLQPTLVDFSIAPGS